MSKNHMSEVANILSLEIGDEFNILYEDGSLEPYSPYKLFEDTISNRYGCEISADVLLSMLSGKYIVEKCPWRPKYGEIYWYVDIGGDITNVLFDGVVWDFGLQNMGNCFSSEKAAEAAVPEMLAKFEEIEKGVRE